MEQLFPLAQSHVLLPLLERLTPDAPPRWGAMQAQQMIEHLEFVVNYSISDTPIPILTPEKQLGQVVEWLRTSKPLPRGFNSPLITIGPLKYPDLPAAGSRLVESLSAFFRHYAEHPTHQSIHPVFGKIDYEDWLRFHQKHFQHHFTQFGLLEE